METDFLEYYYSLVEEQCKYLRKYLDLFLYKFFR